MIFSRLKKHWFLIGVALCCFWGYSFPWAGEKIGDHLKLLVMVLMSLMGMGIGYPALSRKMGRWHEAGAVLFLGYLVAPLIGFALGRLFFFQQPAVYCGMMLVGTTCTTLSTCIVFTRLAGGDDALALWLSVLSSFLCALVMPLLLSWSLGRTVQVPVGLMIRHLATVLVLPLAAGMLLRGLLGEDRISPAGPVLTRSCALIILAVIMVAVAKGRRLLGSPGSLPVLAAVAGFHLVLLGAAALLGRVSGYSRPARIAVIFCASQKTLQFPTYLAVSVLGQPEAALPAVLFHVFQLVVGSALVSRLSSQSR
ncbi:MAG: bile acid:sodium symporter family protein [Candidatus Glassbacteria bacterium]|nr:bile acid:sodium symporter family protein [Candidatus Glassbacteria bacterium]